VLAGLALAASLVAGPASPAAPRSEIHVPDDVPTLQQAIARAQPGDTIVGLALAGPSGVPRQLLALGVAPGFRRRGLAGELLRALTGQLEGEIEAVVTVAERDPVKPLDHELRSLVGGRLLDRAGFEVRQADAALGRVDPYAIRAVRR